MKKIQLSQVGEVLQKMYDSGFHFLSVTGDHYVRDPFCPEDPFPSGFVCTAWAGKTSFKTPEKLGPGLDAMRLVDVLSVLCHYFAHQQPESKFSKWYSKLSGNERSNRGAKNSGTKLPVLSGGGENLCSPLKRITLSQVGEAIQKIFDQQVYLLIDADPGGFSCSVSVSFRHCIRYPDLENEEPGRDDPNPKKLDEIMSFLCYDFSQDFPESNFAKWYSKL